MESFWLETPTSMLFHFKSFLPLENSLPTTPPLECSGTLLTGYTTYCLVLKLVETSHREHMLLKLVKAKLCTVSLPYVLNELRSIVVTCVEHCPDPSMGEILW